MQYEHRTWFPFILIGLTVTLVFVLAVFLRPSEAPTPPLSPSSASSQTMHAPTREAYDAAVRDLLTQHYARNVSANATYEALIELRVPEERKDVHLQLVILLNEERAGNQAEARARYDVLRQAHPWLP